MDARAGPWGPSVFRAPAASPEPGTTRHMYLAAGQTRLPNLSKNDHGAMTGF